MTRKQLESKAAKLAQKFFDDCQVLFDDAGMDEDLAYDDIFTCLCSAQSEAEAVLEASK